MILYDDMLRRFRAAGMFPHKAIVSPEVIHAEFGPVSKFDELFTSLEFYDTVDRLRALEFMTRSEAPEVSGDIVVIPSFDGVDRAPFVVAVGADWQRKVVYLFADVGKLSLRIDTADPRYTLTDGVNIVTAYLRCIKTWEEA